MATSCIHSPCCRNTPQFHCSPEKTKRAKTFQVQINKEMPQKSGRDRDYALTPGHIPPSSCQQLISLHCHLHQDSPISPDTSPALLLPPGLYLLPPPAKTQPRVKGQKSKRGLGIYRALLEAELQGWLFIAVLQSFMENEMPSKSVTLICPVRKNSRKKLSLAITMVN